MILFPGGTFFVSTSSAGAFFFVAGLLFSTNNDRDYIRAIDAYLRERYQVKVLFTKES